MIRFFLVVSLSTFTIPSVLQSQLITRTWTGAIDNNFMETFNWNPQGPPTDARIIIPQTTRDPILRFPVTIHSLYLDDTLSVDSVGAPTSLDSVHIRQNGRLLIGSNQGTAMAIGGKLIVDAGGRVNITSAINLTDIDDDIVLNGSLTIDSGITAAVWCHGNWIRGSGSGFSPGTSRFYFTNLSRQLNVDRGTFHTLYLGPVLGVLRIVGNVNIIAGLILRDSVAVSHGDTITVSNRSSVALNDSLGGRVVRGAVRRAIDTTTGRIRFHDSNIAVEFLDTTGIPNFITVNAQPETTFLPTPLRYVRRFYDIGREGGGGFRARLRVRYDSTEIEPGTVEDSLRLWRTTDEGVTWLFVPSTVNTDSNFIEANNVGEFSKWGFGIPSAPPVSVLERKNPLPAEFDLSQNYPNPFNPSTKIEFSIDNKSFVTLAIYSSIGQEIAILVEETLDAGTYEIEWRPYDLPSGLYLYRMSAGSYIKTMKMLLLR